MNRFEKGSALGAIGTVAFGAASLCLQHNNDSCAVGLIGLTAAVGILTISVNRDRAKVLGKIRTYAVAVASCTMFGAACIYAARAPELWDDTQESKPVESTPPKTEAKPDTTELDGAWASKPLRDKPLPLAFQTPQV